MKPYTNKDRWRHIKHFVDTHPYSESNLEYLKNWLTSFTNESMTTENASSENRSHERKTKDEDSRPLPSNPIIADISHPFGLRVDDSIPRKETHGESANKGDKINLNALKEYIEKHGRPLSDSPTDYNASDWDEKC